MDYTKEYIIQAISIAANNLRLSSEKIESVAILKSHINKCTDLEGEIIQMKKITELSKLGIRLGEIFQYFERSNVDFLKVSDNFKEHSHSLITVMSNLLDVITPDRLNEVLLDVDESDLIKIEEDNSVEEMETNPLKEEIIMDEVGKKEKSFEEFQKQILKPVKGIDDFLSRMLDGSYHRDELKSYIEIMKLNSELAEKEGLVVISQMHVIFAVGLKLILEDKLVINKSVVESLRACVIVIVAMIKSKSVDITAYLDRAEKFGEQILQYK